MKKMTGNQKSRRILEMSITHQESLNERRKYEAEKKKYEESYAGKFEAKERANVQEATKAEELAFKAIKDSMKVLREKTFDLICEELARFEEERDNVSDEMIEATLKQVRMSLNKLKKMSEAPYYVERLNPNYPTEYDKLFSDLMDKVDIRFALYASKKSLSRLSIRFNKMPDELKDEMFERLTEFGLFEDEKYLENYENAFIQQINKGVRV